MSHTRELRYGKKGSFVYTIQGSRGGKWHDFETGEGGDLFSLVRRELKLNEFKDQLDYVAAFYGLSHDREWVEKARIKEDTPVDLKDSKVEDNLDHKKQERVNKAYEISKPLEGTLAERYLREHRKIEGNLPPSLRCIPYYGKEKLPALVAFATDVHGKRTGMQVTYLDSQTAKKANVDVNKRSYGKIGGASVVIQKGSGLLFVAEGVETALSISSAVPKDSSVLAVLGVSNFKNLTIEKGQRIIICADNDTHKPHAKGQDKSPSEIAVEKAARQLEEKGAQVTVLKPEIAGWDFNDVLQKEGIKGVSRYFAGLLEKIETKEKEYDVAPLANPSSSLEDQLRTVILDHLRDAHKSQHGKDPSDSYLRAQNELVSLATSYLKHATLSHGSTDLLLKAKSCFARAQHEIKESPSRIQDYISRLNESEALDQSNLLQARLKGQRLAMIEGRLIEESLMREKPIGEEDIRRVAKQEVFENKTLLHEIENKYTATGMERNQAEEMASLCINHKQMFGLLPEGRDLENIKEILSYLKERQEETKPQEQRDHNKGLLRSKSEYMISQEALILMRVGEFKSLSSTKLKEIQCAVAKGQGSASKEDIELVRRDERNITKEIEIER